MSRGAAPMNQAPHVQVAIAIISDAARQRVLICRRPHDTVLPNLWEFPGGKCHDHEALAACAVREAREEVGIEIVVRRALTSIRHSYPHALVDLHPFICQHVTGTPRALAVQEWRWVNPGALASYEFPAANRDLLVLVASQWDALTGA